jgi:hypothetical protein
VDREVNGGLICPNTQLEKIVSPRTQMNEVLFSGRFVVQTGQFPVTFSLPQSSYQ